jgi:hypothetical protein
MQEPRGDVTGLFLTPDSMTELTRDVHASDVHPGASDLRRHAGYVTQGRRLTELLNPVTRSAITVSCGSSRDEVRISYGSHRPASTLPVPDLTTGGI